jgi:hypothetical protein
MPDHPETSGRLNWLGYTLVLVTALFALGLGLSVGHWLVRLNMPFLPSGIVAVAIALLAFGLWVFLAKTCQAIGIPIETRWRPSLEPGRAVSSAGTPRSARKPTGAVRWAICVLGAFLAAFLTALCVATVLIVVDTFAPFLGEALGALLRLAVGAVFLILLVVGVVHGALSTSWALRDGASRSFGARVGDADADRGVEADEARRRSEPGRDDR